MRSPEALEEAIDFLVHEVVRLGQLELSKLAEEMRENSFANITDWRGNLRPMGGTATELLHELTDEGLAESQFHRRVSPARAYSEVLKLIGARYINPDRRVLEGSEIARDINEGIAEAARDCAARTHFIPCSILLPKEEKLALGPVLIRPVEEALADLDESLKHYTRAEGEISPEERRKHAETALAYYKAFPDVAVVTVPGCDEPTSESVALEAVQAVLNSIHVLAGAGFTRRLRAGGPALNRDSRGTIVKGEDGSLLVSRSMHFGGGANVGEQWWEGLRKDEDGHLQAIGVAVQAIVDTVEPQLLAARFLDACAWYGDAARDTSTAAAIVKYLTSMERLLWAGENGPGVTKRLAERAAALCFSTLTWNLGELGAEVRRAYDIRSGLVHGRISPADPEVRKSLRLCERVSRKLLRTWLGRYGGDFDRPVEVAQLKAYFDAFVRRAKEDCAAAKARAAHLHPTV